MWNILSNGNFFISSYGLYLFLPFAKMEIQVQYSIKFKHFIAFPLKYLS